VRGAGGWGGDRGPSAEVNVPPTRAPDKTFEQKTDDNQALLYRLSGDWNPLHADPSFAKNFGFAKPILHGLATYGFATRAVVNAFAPEQDPRYVKSIRVRFASTVLPGDTIITEMWKEGDKVIFRCTDKEKAEVCISNAAIEFWKELPKPKAKAAAAPAVSAAVPNSGDIFRAIGTFVGGNPATAEKVKTTFLFKLSAPESAWTIDLSTPPGTVSEGAVGKAACTLEMSDADFMAMATGQADAMKLFSTGKLKIAGDVMASQKLGFLKKLTPEMVMAETKKRGGGSAGAAVPPTAASYTPTVEDAFEVFAEVLKQNPEIAAKVGVVYGFKVGDKRYILDLKNGAGGVSQGEAGAECTLELAETDFLDLTQGKADPMKLFTTGKLKISGNVMASQKLQSLFKIDPSKAIEAVMKRKGVGGAAPAAAAPAAAPAKAAGPAHAQAFFAAMDKRLNDNKNLASEIRATIHFKVTDPAAEHTLHAAGGITTTATLTIKDADLPALAAGNAKSLYQHGQLRVDGDVSVAHRLGFLKGVI
jgi:(3R)-3-hydroxyacyl-CoA dehydrogenase / 3a,7a,12a-trihydroxy-5b-cholest-24-enoyl-CoA hydratase / enoyl-CoA hydratase 2